MCLCVKNVISGDFVNSKKRADKRGTRLKSSGPSDCCEMCKLFYYLSGQSWQEVLHICTEYILKMLHSMVTKLFSGESSFYDMFRNIVCKKLSAVFRKQA